MAEIFNGFISWDSKFWTTLLPLLTKPGKVSKNFIDGKRARYSNPFQFYLTVSILFFLILGLSKNIDKFQSLKNGSVKKQEQFISFDEESNKDIDIDSLKNAVNTSLKNSWLPIDSIKRKEIVDQVLEEAKDSTKTTGENRISFDGLQIDKFIKFQKKHPDMSIDISLDSLQQEKTFFNRFLYSRAKTVNSFLDKEESRNQFFSQILSYASVALFIFLPLFTLSLKLFYIRKKHTYVEHLVFVFHTQTVFFMLFSIYYVLELFGFNPKLWIFTLLFLIYLFIAMRNFYSQNIFKTLVKFTLINCIYFSLATIGVVLVGVISFALL